MIEYRANVSAPLVPETIMVLGANGGYLITSDDATPTLRGLGTANLGGAAFAQEVEFSSTAINLTISPATITATTVTVVMSGTVANAGVAGCTVTFRAALTLLPPGGY